MLQHILAGCIDSNLQRTPIPVIRLQMLQTPPCKWERCKPGPKTASVKKCKNESKNLFEGAISFPSGECVQIGAVQADWKGSNERHLSEGSVHHLLRNVVQGGAVQEDPKRHDDSVARRCVGARLQGGRAV